MNKLTSKIKAKKNIAFLYKLDPLKLLNQEKKKLGKKMIKKEVCKY